MKKVLLTGALIALFSFSALAQSYEPIYFKIDNVNTSATASTYSTALIGGQIMAVAAQPTTGMTFKVETTSGYGMSLNSAKTVVAATNIVKGVGSAAVVGTHYIWNDIVIISAYSADAVSNSVTGYILIKKD